MTSNRARIPEERHAPKRRWPWIASGFALEATAMTCVAVVVAHESHSEDPAGTITKYSLRLAWHDIWHRGNGLLFLAACLTIYVIGAVLVARSFVKNRKALFIAVPLFAAGSVVLLGIAGFLLFLLAASEGTLVGDWVDPSWLWTRPDSRHKRESKDP